MSNSSNDQMRINIKPQPDLSIKTKLEILMYGAESSRDEFYKNYVCTWDHAEHKNHLNIIPAGACVAAKIGGCAIAPCRVISSWRDNVGVKYELLHEATGRLYSVRDWNIHLLNNERDQEEIRKRQSRPFRIKELI